MAAVVTHPLPELSVAFWGKGPRGAVLATWRLRRQCGARLFEVLITVPAGDRPFSETVGRGGSRVRILGIAVGSGRSRNLDRALDRSAGAPLLTLVRPGERVMGQALALLHRRMVQSPDTGLVHAWWFTLPDREKSARRALESQQQRLRAFLPPHLRHLPAMVALGNVVQALPTFRVETLRSAPPVRNGTLEQALHIAALRESPKPKGSRSFPGCCAGVLDLRRAPGISLAHPDTVPSSPPTGASGTRASPGGWGFRFSDTVFSSRRGSAGGRPCGLRPGRPNVCTARQPGWLGGSGG